MSKEHFGNLTTLTQGEEELQEEEEVEQEEEVRGTGIGKDEEEEAMEEENKEEKWRGIRKIRRS